MCAGCLVGHRVTTCLVLAVLEGSAVWSVSRAFSLSAWTDVAGGD
jgi:hypothetical protein